MAHCNRAAMVMAGDHPGGDEEANGESEMSLETNLAELQRKHGELEREIDSAMRHPSVDALELAQLKRRKLAIKDEMERLRVAHTRH